jgi:DNA-binding GntR family transcriptional regulator
VNQIFSRIEPVSKKARVVASIRDAIVSGALQAGEQIVEAKMAQQFGVGQGIVREALIELEHQGFVQRTPYSGTQVVQLTLDDAKKIFQMRLELEPLAFELAASNAKPDDLLELRKLLVAMKTAEQAQDLDAVFEIQLSYRKKVWKLSGNHYLQQALERLVIPLYALYFIRRTQNRDAVLRAVQALSPYEDEILDALDKRDGEKARRAEREFLTKAKQFFDSAPMSKD